MRVLCQIPGIGPDLAGAGVDPGSSRSCAGLPEAESGSIDTGVPGAGSDNASSAKAPALFRRVESDAPRRRHGGAASGRDAGGLAGRRAELYKGGRGGKKRAMNGKFWIGCEAVLLAFAVAGACRPAADSGGATPSLTAEDRARASGASVGEWLREVDTSTMPGLLAVLVKTLSSESPQFCKTNRTRLGGRN